MKRYNVHIYREMKLLFPDIEAATPDEAARIAADRPTADALYTEDCEGENLAALVDLVGDDEFTHSVTIDFRSDRNHGGGITANGFFIDTAASDEQYLFIDVDDFTVAIKREAEGIVVDLFPLHVVDEPIASTYAFHSDIDAPADGRTS